MATPHNFVHSRINPVYEFFDDPIDDEVDTFANEIKNDELESVDQVI